MAPLPAWLLLSLKEVIDRIPEQAQTYKNQTESQQNKRSKERSLFRKFLAKLAGNDKEDQVAFLVNQAKVISRKTYIKAMLQSIPKQPDYLTI